MRHTKLSFFLLFYLPQCRSTGPAGGGNPSAGRFLLLSITMSSSSSFSSSSYVGLFHPNTIGLPLPRNRIEIVDAILSQCDPSLLRLPLPESVVLDVSGSSSGGIKNRIFAGLCQGDGEMIQRLSTQLFLSIPSIVYLSLFLYNSLHACVCRGLQEDNVHERLVLNVFFSHFVMLSDGSSAENFSLSLVSVICTHTHTHTGNECSPCSHCLQCTSEDA